MKDYKSESIRNVAFCGHGRSGKTSLLEAALFDSGATTRLGNVDQGTGVLDFEPEETKRKIEAVLGARKDIDIILSHTCPKKYIPTEMFLPMIDQSSVDNSTEEWLDTIEDAVDYKAWYCGHWHTDKRIDKMHFLFTTFESLGD